MKIEVQTRKSITYKNHFIRKVEDIFHNVFVLIDNPNKELENAPKYMQGIDFHYASISDAKRAIRGEPMIYVDGDMYECRRDNYLNRFKK